MTGQRRAQSEPADFWIGLTVGVAAGLILWGLLAGLWLLLTG